jgi:hypothetical protein
MAADHREGFEPQSKPIRRDTFLATMEKIVPWLVWNVGIERPVAKLAAGPGAVCQRGLGRGRRAHFAGQ